MDKENKLPSRKATRLNNFDYNAERTYFITICTDSRRKILSRIVGDGVLDVPNAYGISDTPNVELLPYGKIVDKYINQLNDFYEYITVDKYVIMPEHIHLILCVSDSASTSRTPDGGTSRTPDGGTSRTPDGGTSRTLDGGTSRTPSPTTRQNAAVSQFVSTLKRFCGKEFGENIWQRGFYDHIIRNYEDYEKHTHYIIMNPAHRLFDENKMNEP